MQKSEQQHLKIVRYSPDSDMRTPGRLVAGLIADLRENWDLSWRLFVRNMSSQYRQTIFGYAWVVLPPLVMSIVWIFLNSQNVVSIADTGVPYAPFAFAGNLLWQSFALALQIPVRTVQKEKAMLTKINFSREAILVAGFGEALFTGLLQLILFIPLLFIFKIPLDWPLLLAPVGMFLMVLLGYTLGTFLTPIGLLYMDIGRGIPILTRFWFFVTPVVYAAPKEFPAAIINYINPVSPILVTARNWMTGQPTSMPLAFIMITIGMFILLFASLLMYRLAMPHIVERMSS